MEKPQKVVRVSVSEAARLFGVSGRTVRRGIANDEVTYIVVHGRYKINFESLVKWSQKRSTTRNKLANNGIGQFVNTWKISNKLYSPNAPDNKTGATEKVQEENPPNLATA